VIVTSGLCALVLLGGAALWLRHSTAAATATATDAATVTDTATATATASASPPPPPPPPPPVVTPALPDTVRLSLATDPPGADVLLDGVVRGHTPLVLEVPRGDGELSVTFHLAGWKDKTRAVRARGDAALDVALERLPPAKPAPRPAKPAKPLDDDAVLPPNF
jgi:serine/threonine-protein kinase